MKANQINLFLLTLLMLILKVNSMKAAKLAFNLGKNQFMKPNVQRQAYNRANIIRERVAQPLGQQAIRNQRAHIPINQNGNRMNNMNNYNNRAQENMGQQDRWGQLLEQSEQTGKTVYELMAEMRAERRAKTEQQVQQQIKNLKKQDQEFIKEEVKKNDLIKLEEKNISQVLSQNKSFQNMLLKNFKIDQNQLNFYKNLNHSQQNIIIKDLIKDITTKDMLSKKTNLNNMSKVFNIQKGFINLSSKDLLQTMENFNKISSNQALQFIQINQGDKHQLMNIAKKLSSLTIKSNQKQSFEQIIPSGQKLESKNSQELIDHINEKTNQQIEQIKQKHQEIINEENIEQPKEIINVPQEQTNIIEQKQNTNLQEIKNEEANISQIKKEQTELQIKNPEKIELIDIKNEQKHLDDIKPNDKSLEVINKGMNDLSIIKPEQTNLTEMKQQPKEIQINKPEQTNLTEMKQQPQEIEVIKPEQTNLNEIKQQPSGILINKPKQTNLTEIKQQPSGIEVIKSQNKDMIIQKPIEIALQDNIQLKNVIENNPQVKELLEIQIENVKFEQQNIDLDKIKKIQPSIGELNNDLKINTDQQPMQNLNQINLQNMNPQNLNVQRNFGKMPNSMFFYPKTPQSMLLPLFAPTMNILDRIQITDNERNIIQQEADKINNNNTIKNINQIYGTDESFKPNWYKDLMRENPIFSHYNKYKNINPKQEQIQPKKLPLKTPSDYFKFMEQKYMNFNPLTMGFNGIPLRKLPYPLYQIKMYDYEIPDQLKEELDEVKTNLTQIYQEEIKKFMAIDLAYYNIILNIEEMCIEDERLSLKQCSQASKVLIEFYMPLKKHLRRDFVYIQNQILNKLTSINLDVLVENLEENNILENWCQLYSKMQGRLEYLLLRYTAVQII